MAAMAIAGWFCVAGACGASGNYSRGDLITDGSNQSGGRAGDSVLGSGGDQGEAGTGGFIIANGSGGAGSPRTGGASVTTGGLPGTGGATGGNAVGGVGAGAGAATGGIGAVIGTGGVATGGIVSTGGRASTGGVVGSGGVGTGGAVGSGGAGTGGILGSGGGVGSGTGGATSQQILSIDFVGAIVTGTGGSRVATPAPMALTEVAGLYPAANWNSAGGPAGTLTPLLRADGTSTSASVTWSAPYLSTSFGVYFVGMTDAPGNTRMMNGYLDPSNGTTPASTITVSGLPWTGGCDVYVYFLGGLGNLPAGETRSHKLAIGSASFTVSQAAPSPTIFPGFTLATATAGDYVVFKNVTGTSFTLTSTAVSGTTKRAPVNGLQIVWPTGS